ncbi:MAG: hypothetical protein K0S42_29 [Microvirga sp.]|jgi:hypothetical protein|nr:hypothetical protein [Microvirga sp.]
MRIDASRLSRLLLSLSKAPEKAERKDVSRSSSSAVAPSAPVRRRDADALRSRLRARLQELRRGSKDFETQAPVVTVQEILRWEFGNQVLEHPDFQKVVQTVAGTLSADGRLGPALQAIIAELSAD